MRCRDIDALESAYIDGDLDEARASAFRGHLRVCERCHREVADLATMVEAASRLEPVDPPPSLWRAIEGGLAEAEIADAQRSWLWLRWQALRPRLLPATVALAAAAVLVTWLMRKHHEPAQRTRMLTMVESADAPTHEGDRDGAQAASPAPEAPAEPAEPALTFTEARARQVAEADRRYLSAIEELRVLIEAERQAWPEGMSAAYEARVSEFEAAARRHRQALAVNQAAAPRDRDALHAVYLAEIDFLQRAVMDGAEAFDAFDAADPGGI